MPSLLAVLVCLGALPVAAASLVPPDPLDAGTRLEDTLGAGETRDYEASLAHGDCLRVIVDQRGVDVAVSLAAPDGTVVTSVDSPNDRRGPETLSWVAEQQGSYRLRVAGPRADAPRGGYELRVEALGPATADDRRRARADGLMAEAARLFSQRSAEGLRAAREKAESARAEWHLLEDASEEAKALHLAGLIHKQLDAKEPALDHHRRSLALREAIGDRSGQADSLNQIALVRWSQGGHADALAGFEKAQALWREVEDKDGEARALGNLALVLQSAGRLPEALERYRETLAVMRPVAHPSIGTVLNNIGSIYNLVGRPQEALASYEEALPFLERPSKRRIKVDTLSNMATLKARLGAGQAALELYHEALALAHAAEYHRGAAVVRYGIGGVHLKLGSPEQALAYLEPALEASRAAQEKRQVSVVLSRIGRAHALLHQEERARRCFAEAAELAEGVGDTLGTALHLVDGAAVRVSLGETDAAARDLDRALRLYRELGATHGEAATQRRIAALHRERQDLDRAREAYLAALALHTQGSDPRGHAEALTGLARVEAGSGRLKEAQRHLEQALDVIESLRANVFRADLRASWVATNRAAYETAVEVLMQLHDRDAAAGYDAKAFAVSERFRARALLDVLAAAGYAPGLSADLARRVRSVQERINALADFDADGPEASRTLRARELDAALEERRELEADIRAADPRYAALIAPRPANVSEIQSDLLDRDTVLLEYLLGETRSFGWLVSADALHVFTLPPRAAIEAAARRVRASWWQPAPEPWEAAEAQSLSRLLLGPVADQLRGKRLAIVSDGALQYLPFAALPEPAGAGVLLESREVVGLPSASVLGALRRESPARAQPKRLLAVFADPVFDAGDPRLPKRVAPGRVRATASTTAPPPPRFFRLAATRREAQVLLSLDRDNRSRAALGLEASRETALDPELAEYRFVHFATHGSLDARRPELSALVLSLVAPDGSERDGFLRLHEISGLKLNADLVVLSACDTGLGRDIEGEGLVGLARAFMQAGVPRVVASLWKVPELATTEVMRHLYRGMLREGQSPAAALRRAQLAVRSEPRWRRPHHWAGFVLQGEWRP